MKAKFTPVLIGQDRLMDAMRSDEYVGFCRACGEEAYGVEPDMRCGKCEVCGARKVYGAEELLIMEVA